MPNGQGRGYPKRCHIASGLLPIHISKLADIEASSGSHDSPIDTPVGQNQSPFQNEGFVGLVVVFVPALLMRGPPQKTKGKLSHGA